MDHQIRASESLQKSGLKYSELAQHGIKKVNEAVVFTEYINQSFSDQLLPR